MNVDFGKSPKVSPLKYYGTNNIDTELIYPDGNTIVSVNTADELQVWNKEDGQLVNNKYIAQSFTISLNDQVIDASIISDGCLQHKKSC